MKKMLFYAAVVVLAASPLFAGTNGKITGSYVEARTAEVFTGGCTMGSEAETGGREAILAWRIATGTHNGVTLDGLSVVAAVSGDRNLGIRELGGVAPSSVKAVVMVDDRATEAQKTALLALAKELSNGLMNNVVDVQAAPIAFTRDEHTIHVSAGQASLAVGTEVTHDPSCGAMQWFHPFASSVDASLGFTSVHTYSGNALGRKWSDPNKRSAFFGTFSY